MERLGIVKFCSLRSRADAVEKIDVQFRSIPDTYGNHTHILAYRHHRCELSSLVPEHEWGFKHRKIENPIHDKRMAAGIDLAREAAEEARCVYDIAKSNYSVIVFVTESFVEQPPFDFGSPYWIGFFSLLTAPRLSCARMSRLSSIRMLSWISSARSFRRPIEGIAILSHPSKSSCCFWLCSLSWTSI
ncbi:uncharacterized protein ARMOST_01260 [Armillaria ostoyae]|uniref:Uncharacterized protein n=1 Tax=Armillaria ostoyae TaxID=47428 RepID=A0A284QNG6_ARMOS|nr:uncharacterized protein ARMOST_01260 [Armillaria ostoyae]